MLSPPTLLIAGVILLLTALQLRLRWHGARHGDGKNRLSETVDADIGDPALSPRLTAACPDAPLLDYWGGPEPD